MKQLSILLPFLFLILPQLQAQLPSYVPSTGLVAWYPFNGNAQDQSGNGNHGAPSNATMTTDRDGNLNAAYSFNGGNSLIDCGNIFDLNNASQVTLTAWFYSLGNISSSQVISKEHYQSNANGFHIGYSSSGGNNMEVMMSINAHGSGEASTVAINTEEWYHVALVFDGPASTEIERLKMYINGTMVPLSFNYPIPDMTSAAVYPLYIGNNYGFVSVSQWYGKIDDVGIWNAALSAQQISDLYDAIDMTVGIDGAHTNNHYIAYDPSSNLIRYNAPINGRAHVRIYNQLGALVLEQRLGQTLNVSTLPHGMYILQLNGTNAQHTFRFVKR